MGVIPGGGAYLSVGAYPRIGGISHKCLMCFFCSFSSRSGFRYLLTFYRFFAASVPSKSAEQPAIVASPLFTYKKCFVAEQL